MGKIDGKTGHGRCPAASYKLLFYKYNIILLPSYPQAKHFLDSNFWFQYDGRVFPEDSLIDIMQSESQAKEVAENPALLNAVSSAVSTFHRT